MKIADLIGRSPIPVPYLVVGKFALLGCVAFVPVKMFWLDAMLVDTAWTQTIGAILYLLGFAIIIISIVDLGQSVAVGLPERHTELRVHGMYRVTRNPVYVGGFVLCAGSCLFAMHLVNLLCFVIAAAVHMKIVAKEERFLEARFGDEWLDYAQRVPRYIGRIR